MDTSDLAKRMKNYEKNSDIKLMKRTPVAIRLDMRAGHTFTKGFNRPFDKVFMESMQQTMKYLCENIENAVMGYCQSDEITIIMVDYRDLNTECFFDNRIQKLCSISASMATMAFNNFFREGVAGFDIDAQYDANVNGAPDPELLKQSDIYHKAADKGAMFDARCFNIPKEEVTNLVYWRQLDATRNSIQMVGQANFSHKELQNKSCNMIQDMLHEQRGINWNDFPTDCKRGACAIQTDSRERVVSDNYDLDGNVIGKIEVIRKSWIIDRDIPIFKGENRQYIDKLVDF